MQAARVILLVCLCAPWVIAAPVPKPKRSADQELILGRWQVVGRETNGGPRSGVEDSTWVFETDKMTIYNGKGSTSGSVFTYKLDPTASLKQLDITIGNSHYQGLYELEGDELKWANTGPGGKRPSEVSSKDNVYLIIFKRVK